MEDKNKKIVKKVTNNATLILILIAVVLVIIGYGYLTGACEYTLNDLINDAVGNLIGVLVAFLLFDIVYNKLTQDAYSKEISQQITKTLMGDPETLGAFSEEDKKAFLKSTIVSIAEDPDKVDIIMDKVNTYLDSKQISRIRKSFTYMINIITEFPNAYKDFPGVKENKYFYVQEKLSYEIKYLEDHAKNLKSNEVKIGFLFDKRHLDTGLIGSDHSSEFSKCIFNENLDITREAIDYFKNLSYDELQKVYNELFSVALKVDAVPGELQSVRILSDGIIATYTVNCDLKKHEHAVGIIFHMPKLWDSVFEVTLVDPTKDPNIIFDYMPEKMDVTMYSYLNKEKATNEGAYEQQNGLFDLATKGEWIYPKSGVVFSVRRKEVVENGNDGSNIEKQQK